MDKISTLLMIAVLIGSILWDMKLTEKGKFNELYLSKKQSGMVKGALALLIVVYHLSLGIHSGILFRLFSHAGWISVSMFFFYTGYGLMKNHLSNPDYQKTYLRRRIPAVAIPYLLAIFIYGLAYSAAGVHIKLNRVLAIFAHGNGIVSFSWYLDVILLFYLGFYFLMFFGKNTNAIILTAALLLAALDSYFIYRDFAEYWYGTSHLLVVGMLWSANESKILSVVKKHYRTALLISLGTLAAVFVISRPFNGYFGFFLRGIMYAFCAISALLIQLKISLGNAWLAFLGKISFELYLYHGLLLTFGFNAELRQLPESVLMIVVIGAGIIAACPCRWISQRLLRLLPDRRSDANA